MRSDTTLTVVQRAVALMELEQFSAVDSEELANIASKALEARFEQGEVLASQKEPSDKLFLILEGEVGQVRNGVVVRRATRGMSVGLYRLLGVVDGENDELRALTPTHALALTREDFVEAIVDHPGFAVGVIQGLGRTILHYAKLVESLERQLLELAPAGAPPARRS